MKKGFYTAIKKSNACGLTLSVVYIPENQDFQIAARIGWYIFAVGYDF